VALVALVLVSGLFFIYAHRNRTGAPGARVETSDNDML